MVLQGGLFLMRESEQTDAIPLRVAPKTVQGYLAHKKHPPPQDHHRSLDRGRLYGPIGGVFLMSEVPLRRGHSQGRRCGDRVLDGPASGEKGSKGRN